jgi:hypothetical protein
MGLSSTGVTQAGIHPLTLFLTDFQSILVNSCSPKPAHLFLVSGPVATHDHIFVLFRLLCAFKWGLLFSKRTLDYYWLSVSLTTWSLMVSWLQYCLPHHHTHSWLQVSRSDQDFFLFQTCTCLEVEASGQSVKLLLALTSTAIPCWAPLGPMTVFFLSRRLRVLKWGLLLFSETQFFYWTTNQIIL